MYPEKQSFFVLGLSRSGKSAAQFLLSRGGTVYIYDDITSERVEKTAKELEEKGARRVPKERLSKTSELCDVLVLSPGIPIDHPLAVAFKRKGKAVVGETEIAARYMRCPVIGITGTNGKTTTVSMLTDVLCAGGYQAKACGNVGTPMIDFCNLEEKGVAVTEISSFQLETLNSLCPHIAIVLNVTEDHLNRHYNMENYIFLKAKLLKNSSEAEYAVLNYDDPTVRAFAERTKANVLFFSVRERVNGAYLENGTLYYQEEKIVSASELLIGGLHNLQNALAAIVAAKIMGVSTQAIVSALTAFKGVRHRIEPIGEVEGVLYIDDSKGTNVDATVKAVSCIKRETVLLLGGKNKGYDYSRLFAALKKSSVVHAVLYGENRYELLKCARAQSFEHVTVCDKFELAVKIAAMLANRGQAVLLSPASASFDEFASYEERGEAFVRIVHTFEKAKQVQEQPREQTREQSQAPSAATDGDDGIESIESIDNIDGEDVGERAQDEEIE
ncbi:MAG: UDP-N-acetylmuramoyl-L-alanine--D-glutamate ligase [Clostridia bacterium]|nr:UDP-N-acetylmuramoyl-L-alanine--D-glutamate ligase [Clostridia bacterium]